VIRRWARLTLLVGVAVPPLAAPADDSIPTQPAFASPGAAAEFSPAAALARFSAPADSVYLMGPGDELTLEVWDHPELSGKQVVGPDGRITLAVAGDVRVGGLSRDAARDTLTARLAGLYRDPLVTLRIDRYTANRVHVLGQVANPGLVSFDGPPSLLEAITRAGGLPAGGNGSSQGPPGRCAVFRGRDQVVWVDLRELLRGNLALDVPLRPGDVVYVPEAEAAVVYVLGEVRSAGAIRLTAEMTVMDALAQAGGPTLDANVNALRVIRPGEHLKRKVGLNRLMEPTPERNYLLEENDILYVPRRGVARVDYWLSKINPFATLLLLGTALAP
jgi:polysaccharide export outer membrane protein